MQAVCKLCASCVQAVCKLCIAMSSGCSILCHWAVQSLWYLGDVHPRDWEGNPEKCLMVTKWRNLHLFTLLQILYFPRSICVFMAKMMTITLRASIFPDPLWDDDRVEQHMGNLHESPVFLQWFQQHGFLRMFLMILLPFFYLKRNICRLSRAKSKHQHSRQFLRGQEETASERNRQCGRAGDEPARSLACLAR